MVLYLAPAWSEAESDGGLRTRSGSFAILAAMRWASSRVWRCAAARRPGSSSK
jgi:hypothetical protein